MTDGQKRTCAVCIFGALMIAVQQPVWLDQVLHIAFGMAWMYDIVKSASAPSGEPGQPDE